jgi:uracil-DNA glycosylase family 4
MSPDGSVQGGIGGLLVIGESPGKAEERSNRPFMGKGGTLTRKLLQKFWDGPVLFDYAVKCYVGGPADEKQVEACRPYMAAIIEECQPQRILLLGTAAYQSVLGRSPQALSVRKGYTYLAEFGVPVFYLLPPVLAARNRFLRAMLTEDVEWACTATPERPPWEGISRVITTREDADEATWEIEQSGGGTLDVETYGRMFDTDFRILCAAVCPSNSEHPFVWDEAALKDPYMRKALVDLIENPKVWWNAHNAKFDFQAVWCGLDASVAWIACDTMLWRRLVQADALAGLATAAELVGCGGHKDEAHEYMKNAASGLRSDQKWGQSNLFQVSIPEGAEAEQYAYAYIPRKLLLRYCARDTVASSRLLPLLGSELSKVPEVSRLWGSHIRDAVSTFIDIERRGVLADKQAMRMLSKFLAAEQKLVMQRLSPYGLQNPASSDEVKDLLYDRLGLPVVATTKGGAPSTDKNALKELEDMHPAVADIVAWRGMNIVRNTFAEGLIPHVRPDGRIHPDFRLDGTRTGRLSCRQPNLQNIPRADTPAGKMAKDLFVASPGHVLMQFDYSQLELRVAAMLSGDPLMRQIFDQDIDFHMATAKMISQLVWGIDPSQVTKVHRTAAKTINFALLYGRGLKQLAKMLGCTKKEAEKVQAAILGRFKLLDKWIKQQVAQASRTGFTWTWWDGKPARRRPLWRIANEDDGGNAERASYNTPVQGTGNEFCLASIVEVNKWTKEDHVPAHVVLTVHDSIILEVEHDARHEVAEVVPEIMMQWNSLGVPLKVDCDEGRSWGSLHKWAG